jgi:hypothetical protein
MVGSTGHESTVSPADGRRNTGAPETSFRSTGTEAGIAHSLPLSRSRAEVRTAQGREFGISPAVERYQTICRLVAPHGIGAAVDTDQLEQSPTFSRVRLVRI